VGTKQILPIILLDDDEEDIHIIREVFRELRICNPLILFRESSEFFSYLDSIDPVAGFLNHQYPGLILTDFALVSDTGLCVLKRLKNHHIYSRFPLIMLAGSYRQEEIQEAYAHGSNGCFLKPQTLEDYGKLIHMIYMFWIETLAVPYTGGLPGMNNRS